MGTMLGIWPASLEHGGGGGGGGTQTNVSRCDCPPMKNGKCPVSHSLRYTATCVCWNSLAKTSLKFAKYQELLDNERRHSVTVTCDQQQ